MRQVTLNGPPGDDYTLATLAAYVGVTERTLSRWIEHGEFPTGHVVGGQERWTAADVAAWLHLRGRFLRDPADVAARKAAHQRRRKKKSDRRSGDIDGH